MADLQTLLTLLFLMTLLVALARRSTVPYPILLVLGGLLIGLIPGLPTLELEPEVVFLLFLPPILTSAAFFTPIRDFQANLRPIFLLAIGLVIFTTLLVGVVAHALIPGLPWAAAFALGAIVAPPDAIAATAIAEKLGLPRRLVTVLEGESLINDASALIAYRVASAAALTGVFSLGQAVADFFVAGVGGILVGLVLGWLVNWLLRVLNDTPVEILLTFLGSFASYLLAERLHVSGVLAAVTIGLYTGQRSAQVMSAETRIQGAAVWEMVVFLLNCLAFTLIGLQLPHVLKELQTTSLGSLITYALLISLAVIAVRFVWVFPATYIPRWLSSKLRDKDPAPSWQVVTILGWAGMRGIVSLAAALSLPQNFPQRELIIFLTFGVILVTLVGQGLSLPWLIRRLGVKPDGEHQKEEFKARLVAAMAGLKKLNQLSGSQWVYSEHIGGLKGHYETRQQHFFDRYYGCENQAGERRLAALERLQHELLEAETQALVKLRDEGTINDTVLWQVQRELDLERLKLQREPSG